MNKIHLIDNLDKNILDTLILDARTPYAEIAKKFTVSPGTIHVRVEKMKQAGIIKGTCVQINLSHLGYDVCCFIGITLKRAKDYHSTIEKLKQLPEIIEAHYTTGQYNIFIKLITRSIHDLQNILINEIQMIDEIQSTETLISLQNPISRSINP